MRSVSIAGVAGLAVNIGINVLATLQGREPIETRKSTLKSLLRGKHAGIAFNAHFIADGAIVYRQACALGCEGIVSKRLGSPYRSGRADCG